MARSDAADSNADRMPDVAGPTGTDAKADESGGVLPVDGPGAADDTGAFPVAEPRVDATLDVSNATAGAPDGGAGDTVQPPMDAPSVSTGVDAPMGAGVHAPDMGAPSTNVSSGAGGVDAPVSDLSDTGASSPDESSGITDAARGDTPASDRPLSTPDVAVDLAVVDADAADGDHGTVDATLDATLDATPEAPLGDADAGIVNPDSRPHGPLVCPTTSTSLRCPTNSAAGCTSEYCGGLLWPTSSLQFEVYAEIPFEISDPTGQFPLAYRQAILEATRGWAERSRGRIVFQPCAPCTGRFVQIIPGEGDGFLRSTDQGASILPMPLPRSDAPIPFHAIGHQLGHAVGLSHTYQRPEREHYVDFSADRWCEGSTSRLPPTCALSATGPGAPPLPFGSFGPYDETSKMNSLPADGVCSDILPDPASAMPSEGDVSAMLELYLAYHSFWVPLQPVDRGAAEAPMPNELAVGVQPIGAPAVVERTSGQLDFFVCGSDRRLYTNHNIVTGNTFVGWAGWTAIAESCESPPGAIYSNEDTLHVVIRRADRTLAIATRSAGTWTAWRSLAAPEHGASSGAALAAPTADRLQIVVRGTDDRFHAATCITPAQNCFGLAATPSSWEAIGAGGGPAAFTGRASAASPSLNRTVLVGIGSDGAVWLSENDAAGWTAWSTVPGLTPATDEAEPAVALATWRAHDRLDFFIRDRRNFLVQTARFGTDFIGTYDLAGGLVSSPGATAILSPSPRLDVVALVRDHGQLGVWWKFNTGEFVRPCVLRHPSQCGACGCGGAGQPGCYMF